MDLNFILHKSILKLTEKKIKSPHLDAEILLCKTINKSREFLFAYPEYKFNRKQIKQFNMLIKKRLAGWPVAYLIEEKEFYGLNFFVDKNVLIPRPESELIIEEVLKLNINDDDLIIDIGTGSGCLIITLAKIINKKIKYFGIDISQKALEIAQKNAKSNHVSSVKFLKGNLLEPLINSKFVNSNRKLVIIANLPYLTSKQIKNSHSIKKEPKLALYGGKDGLDYYKKLIEQIKKIPLNNIYLFFEIDPTQKKKFSSIIKKEFPNSTFEIKKDLKGHNRLAVCHPELVLKSYKNPN